MITEAGKRLLSDLSAWGLDAAPRDAAAVAAIEAEARAALLAELEAGAEGLSLYYGTFVEYAAVFGLLRQARRAGER